MSGARVDTIRVAAPRLRVSEVVRRVSETMRRQELSLESYVVTQINKATLYQDKNDRTPDADRDEVIQARRISRDASQEVRSVRLYSRRREYRDGEMKEEKLEEETEQEWQQEMAEETMAMPFDLLSEGRYRYEILERTLIGDHLVFRIGFEPTNRFETALEGEVWIDYSDFTIRRMEGRLAGPSPLPIFINSVPRFMMRMAKLGDRWFPEEFQVEIELNGAMPRIPDWADLHVVMRDFVINGVEYGTDRP